VVVRCENCGYGSKWFDADESELGTTTPPLAPKKLSSELLGGSHPTPDPAIIFCTFVNNLLEEEGKIK
jgi:hypothetical protein